MFEGVVNYCSFHGNVIPLSFVLGFYVTVVMNRWWSQYTTIPWPDSIAVFVSATIHGQVCTKPTLDPEAIAQCYFIITSIIIILTVTAMSVLFSLQRGSLSISMYMFYFCYILRYINRYVNDSSVNTKLSVYYVCSSGTRAG